MYLGISAYNHQSAAALINEEGELINYYREEQLSRIKGDNSVSYTHLTLPTNREV